MVVRDTVIIIGSQLKSLHTLCLRKNVKTINAHCNDICVIEGIQHLSMLQHLNLSSNKLSSTSGLHGLVSLRYLNLASNNINDISGLEDLKQLTYLNLSYNQISSLKGLLELHGSASQLEIIELHGNNLDSISHVASCLKGIISLKHLVLKHKMSDNPVVHTLKYREQILNALPQVKSLDRINRCCVETESINFSAMEDYNVEFSSELCLDTEPMNAKSWKQSNTDDTTLVSSCTNHEQGFLDFNITAQCGTINSVDIPHNCNEEGEKNSLKQSVRNATEGSSQESNKFMTYKVTTFTNASNVNIESKDATNVKGRSVVHSDECGCEKTKNIENGVNKFTYLNMLKEFEKEKDCRWEMEKANKKLVATIHKMKMKTCEEETLQKMVACTVDRLKQSLMCEKNLNKALAKENLEYIKKIKILNEQLCSLSAEKDSSICMLNTALSNANSQLTSMKLLYKREKHDMESNILRLNADLKAATAKNNEIHAKLIAVQKSLGKKEAEFESCLNRMCTDSGCKYQDMASKHLNKQETIHQQEVICLEQKIHTAQQAFTQLENEFREALYIESERYKQAIAKGNIANEKAKKFGTLSAFVVKKEEKHCVMMQEMTSIIRDQKQKIESLIQNKNEITKQLNNQIKVLKTENENYRHMEIQLELHKQEKSKLTSQLTAAQSIVDGLKTERGVWSQELAQKSSSLARNQGHLETKIESLKTEIKNLRKSNESNLDALMIKTKIVEDQTETILKIKEALASKDKEIQKKLEEHLHEQKHLQNTVQTLLDENSAFQEENSNLYNQKKLLDTELYEVKKEQNVLHGEYEKLKKRWSEKAATLCKLEQQVKNISDTSKKRQMKLQEERDEALQSLHMFNAKSQKLIQSHEQMINATNTAHMQELACFEREKNQELERMEKRVILIEKEMCELLRENEQKHKDAQKKYAKLKMIFQEIS